MSMKTWIKIGVVALALVLTACGGKEATVFETVGEQAYEPVAKAEPGQISLLLPEEAVSTAMADDEGGSIYTWDDNVLQLQTMDGGDIRRTVETISGMDYDDLTVMCYEKGELTYYQTVWSAAGEDGTCLGRGLIADDGTYHYCVSLLSPEDSDSQQVYDRLCASFQVTNGDEMK